jgi:hypothetical protein
MQSFAPQFICDLVNDPDLLPTPIGQSCFLCAEFFVENDFGRFIPHVSELVKINKPYHEECWTRMLVGGFYHLSQQCSCYGGPTDHTDPPGLTLRQAAKLAHWTYHQPQNSPAKMLGKLGGAARAANLSPERRSEIAREAANQRWNKDK